MNHATLARSIECRESGLQFGSQSEVVEQVVCIHPQAEQAEHVYRFTAHCANKNNLQRYEALVISPIDSLTAVNRAIRSTLGDGWFATQWKVAD
jgi:hypothetical protein